MHGAARVNGVPLHDAYNQYLAYHEGKAGYARGSYRGKAWLPPVARDVEAWAARYERSCRRCPPAAERLTVPPAGAYVRGPETVGARDRWIG